MKNKLLFRKYIEGLEYSSDDNYFSICNSEIDGDKINISKNLSKIYQIHTLRNVAERLGFNLNEFDKNNKNNNAKKSYILSERLSELYDKKTLYEKLIIEESSSYFPFITYFTFPEVECLKSMMELKEYLKFNKFEITSEYNIVKYGFSDIISRYPEIEYIKCSDKSVSIVYSCTKLLFDPYHTSQSYKETFVCRFPIMVNFLFERRLIEISMPYFYEHFARKLDSTMEYPQRFQQMFETMNIRLVNLLKKPLGQFNFENFSLHIEEKCNGIDMGWQIEPQDLATFDAKQSVVPLKEIFDSFEKTLSKECEAMSLNNPFNGLSLYKIFRAIKEEGHTLRLILSAPFGKKGRYVDIMIIFGNKDTSYPPFLRLSVYEHNIIEKIRFEVWKSLQLPKITNQYSLYSLLNK